MYQDEPNPSPSSAEYLESPHEAKRKALMEKLKKAGLKNAVSPDADLKQLKLALLKGQMEKKDPKAADQKNANNVGKSATMTREQEIASEKQDDAPPSAGKLVKEGQKFKKAAEDIKKNEVQSEDA